MALVMPIQAGTPNQELSVQLDGAEFIVRLFWNERCESWYFELYDSARAAIWLGVRVAVGVPLLLQCVHPNRPLGEFIALDTSGKDLDPGLNDFGDDPARVQLIYLEAAEVTAAAA